jgi:integrase
LIDDYEISKEMSSVYVKQLSYAIRRLEKYLSRLPVVKDFSSNTVNAWLKHESDVGSLGDKSRSNLRKAALTLWKFSGRKLNTDEIRNVKVAKKNPQAWTIEEFTKVVEATDSLTGNCRNGVPRSLYFKTIIWFGLETGLRRRDIWSFDARCIGEDGRAAITQHKTSNSHVVQLSKATLDCINEIGLIIADGTDRSFFPLRWAQSESQFYYWMRKIRKISGIDPEVVNRCLQHLRRTGATLVALDGGIPWQYLGHTKEGLDRKSYVDGVKTSVVQIPSF